MPVAHVVAAARGARTWDGALEVAWRLASAGELDQRGVEGGDFWAIAAEQRLAPLLFTAARTGAGWTRSCAGPMARGRANSMRRSPALTGDASDERSWPTPTPRTTRVRAFEAQADRTRTSIEATAQALLRAYRFARVAALGRRPRDHRRPAARRARDAVPDRRRQGVQAAAADLPGAAAEIVDRAYERATLAGGRLELPLLLCLDEAGNVAPLPNLAEIASTAPSHNIQLVSIFHDLAQARSRYGRQAETVVNSHRARMLLPGVADLDTLRYFAGLIGEEEARDLTRTTGAGGATRSTARRRRPLIAAEALRQLPDRHALLLYGRLAPTQLRLRMWFEDRRLRRLAGGAMSRLEPDDDRWDDRERDSTRTTPRAGRWLAQAVSARAVDVVRAVVEGRLLAARALPAGDPVRVVGGPGPGRGAGRAGGLGDRTTRANGTTRRASSRCCSISSGSRRCCATDSIRFIPTATASAFPRHLIELGLPAAAGRSRAHR